MHLILLVIPLYNIQVTKGPFVNNYVNRNPSKGSFDSNEEQD